MLIAFILQLPYVNVFHQESFLREITHTMIPINKECTLCENMKLYLSNKHVLQNIILIIMLITQIRHKYLFMIKS